MRDNPVAVFGGENRLIELISLIYSAVGEPTLWPTVMDGIAEAANRSCTVMLTHYGHEKAQNIAAFTRADAAFLNLDVQHYAAINVLAEPCDRMFADGTVRYTHLAVLDAEFEKTEFYNDFFRPENHYYTFGIKIPLRNLEPVYVTSLRSHAKGVYSEREGAVLDMLLPHLQRALRLHFEFSILRSGLRASLDNLPQGMVLLDVNGRCVLMNKAAQEILNARDGLRLNKSSLVAARPDESERLSAMISQATSPDGSRAIGDCGAMPISRRRGSPLQIVVGPYFSGRGETPASVAATVSIHDPEKKTKQRTEVLQELYGLTKAEAKLAALLADGRDMAEAAAINGVARETVRSQLKSIFQKTGTRRQAELVRLLLQLPNSSTPRAVSGE